MSDVPAPLEWLIERLSRLIGTATDALEQRFDKASAVEAWQENVTQMLTRYHAAAYLAGSGATAMSDAAIALVAKDVAAQLGFLKNFAAVIQDGAEWQAGWNSRAESYANSIGAPYWRGATKLLPLPSMPKDGTTQCRGNCNCAWDIQQLEGENNYNCYWILGATDHCQSCKQRAADWSPLEIRNGELQ